MIKLVTLTGGVTVVTEIEENEDKYVFKTPLTIQPVPDVKTGQMTLAMVPVNPLKLVYKWEVPKDHVYAIDSLDPQLIKQYEDIVKELELADKGLVKASDDNKPKLKLLN